MTIFDPSRTFGRSAFGDDLKALASATPEVIDARWD